MSNPFFFFLNNNKIHLTNFLLQHIPLFTVKHGSHQNYSYKYGKKQNTLKNETTNV